MQNKKKEAAATNCGAREQKRCSLLMAWIFEFKNKTAKEPNTINLLVKQSTTFLFIIITEFVFILLYLYLNENGKQ